MFFLTFHLYLRENSCNYTEKVLHELCENYFNIIILPAGEFIKFQVYCRDGSVESIV